MHSMLKSGGHLGIMMPINMLPKGALMVEVWKDTMALQNLQQYGCQTGNKLKKNHVT